MESIASELSRILQSETNTFHKVEEDDKDLPTILVSHSLLDTGMGSRIISSDTRARMIVHMQRGKRDMPKIGGGGQGRIWYVLLSCPYPSFPSFPSFTFPLPVILRLLWSHPIRSFIPLREMGLDRTDI
jgi:hypothetical protein